MLIKKKRIASLKNNLKGLQAGHEVIVAIRVTSEFREILEKVGFTAKLEVGETILPAPIFGSVSDYNANGKILIHKDKPKETAYRQIQWSWIEWHGHYKVEKTDIRDLPYERYP